MIPKRFTIKKHPGLGWMLYKNGLPMGDPLRGPFYGRRAVALAEADKRNEHDDAIRSGGVR